MDRILGLTLLFVISTFLSTVAQEEADKIDEIDSLGNERIPRIYSGVFNSYFYHDLPISSDKIDASSATDVTRIMQSQAAGLSISANSYSPGASSRILMRGFRSINGNSQPLILLNGMPLNNSEWNNTLRQTDQSNRLLDIDPNLIESIELVKSSAGRAKYGIVGGNGVINIKTKKGYNGKPRITFRSSFGIDEISKKPLLQSTYAPGRPAFGAPIYRGPETMENLSWGPEIADLYYDGNSNYLFDKNGALVHDPRNNGVPANIYNPYDFFKKGINTNLSLNFEGGGQKFDYLFVASSNTQKGIIPTTNYNRYNLSTVLNYNISHKLSLQLNVLMSNSNADRNIRGSNLSGIMLGLLRTPLTFDNSNAVEDPVYDPSAYEFADGSQRSANAGVYDNPYWSLNKNKHGDKINRQVINLSGQYKLNERLDFLFNVGSDNYSDSRIGGTDINPGLFRSGEAYERNVDYGGQSLDFSTQYQVTKSDVLDILTTIGINYNQNESAYSIIEGTQLRSSNFVSVENLELVDTSFTTNQFKRSGGVLALDLSYKKLLKITGSLKRDYSNKFGIETNGFLSYGLGASLSIAELFSRQKTAKNGKPIDLMILGSIGKFGNDIGVFDGNSKYVKATISGDGFIPFTELNELEVNSIIKSDLLTSEAINAFDIGLDFSVKKRKINLSFIYYNEKSSGLILKDRIASSSGVMTLESNVGSMTNKGFDISFSIRPIKMKSLSWTLNLDFNKNKNTVTNIGEYNTDVFLGGFDRTARSSALKSFPYGVIQGVAFLRNEEGIKIIGDDGFPLVDHELRVLADPNPDWTMYINNSLKLGEYLTFNATIDIKQGGDMYCGTCGTLDYLGKSQRSAEERGTSVVFEGVTESGIANAKSVELAPESGSQFDYYRVRYGFGGITEMNIYDASWIRLRNISIIYDLSNVIKLKAIKKLSISVFAENLFLKSEYPSIDPETNLSGNSGLIGFEYYNNPGTKRYGLTFQATF